MQEPGWELFITQIGSTRRYVVAYFDSEHVLVQMANVIAPGDGIDMVHMEENKGCTLDRASLELWHFFIIMQADKQSPFSFKKNIQLNLREKQASSSLLSYC
jgi:hypothetical protein